MMNDVSLNEPTIEFFKGANSNAIHRVVERAAKKAELDAQRRVSAARLPNKRNLLTRAVNAAIAAHGRSQRDRPSIRLTAPDTGGRPYHFGYSTVTKGTKGGSPGGRGSSNGAGPARASAKAAKGAGHRANTYEAAHQLYTEREGAVDQSAPAVGLEPTEQGTAAPTIKAGPERTREEKEREAREWAGPEIGRGVPGSEMASESSAQAYIEDPSKASPLLGTMASFGTIGDTLEERMRFWDLVHEHASERGGRTQTRMVLELPHEATAQQRYEITRRFTDALRKKGIPFWASIHVPTKSNDSRNYHAHVVCTDRPMSKMIDPETGLVNWDFAITSTRRKKSRNTVTTHPYRQIRDPQTRDRSYVKRMREHLATTVNQVMARAGSGVTYDARSYKDMGLDVAPMKNVSRIVADKIGSRSFVVMDAEWTRRMMEIETQAASARRSNAFLRLQEAESDIMDADRRKKATTAEMARVPKRLRPSPLRIIGRAAADAAARKFLEFRREKLASDFVDEMTVGALRRIADATSPAAAAKRAIDPAAAPAPEDLASLHEAALEELRVMQLSRYGRAAAFKEREKRLKEGWQGKPRGTPQPSMPADAPKKPEQATQPAQASPTPAAATSVRQGTPTGVDDGSRGRGHSNDQALQPTVPAQAPARAPASPAQTEQAAMFASIKARMSALLSSPRLQGLSGAEYGDAIRAMDAQLTAASRARNADRIAAEARVAAAMSGSVPVTGQAEASAMPVAPQPPPPPITPRAAAQPASGATTVQPSYIQDNRTSGPTIAPPAETSEPAPRSVQSRSVATPQQAPQPATLPPVAPPAVPVQGPTPSAQAGQLDAPEETEAEKEEKERRRRRRAILARQARNRGMDR